MSDGDYYSTHQEIQDKVNKVEKKIINLPQSTELEDIRRAVKAILDKLSSMDLYMRGALYRYQGKVYDGEAYKTTIIKEFLQDMKSGKYTANDNKLLEESK